LIWEGLSKVASRGDNDKAKLGNLEQDFHAACRRVIVALGRIIEPMISPIGVRLDSTQLSGGVRKEMNNKLYNSFLTHGRCAAGTIT